MKRIDDILHRFVQNGKTPSVQYLLFDQEQIIHQYKEGFADVAKQKLSYDTTFYNAFSVTKTFTALAVLQLVEKLKIDLDKSAASYLDTFPYSEEITVRQLLSHTSGIPNPNPLAWIHPAEKHQEFDSFAFFKEIFLKNAKLKSGPNKKFAYSNLGYVLLGQLIEQVSGLKYEDYIKREVLDVLRLSRSDIAFEISEPGILAKGYHKNVSLMNWIIGIYIDKKTFRGSAEGKWQPFLPFHLNSASWGGLMGTPKAFMKYVQELLKEDSRLISPKFKKLLFTENLTNEKKATGMCLSWFTGQLNGETYFAHAGGGGGYYCEIRIYLDAGIGSVIMLNRSGMTDKRLLNKLDKHYFSPS